MKRLTVWTLAVLCAVASAAAEVSLQDLIQAAPTGAVVRVPAGTYAGSFQLKEGMCLVGAGADRTILDGGGNAFTVLAPNQAALIGVTVRGGRQGVRNMAGFVGVFDCRLEGQAQRAVSIEGGGGVLANCLVIGSPATTGVFINTANPCLLNNTVASNAVGVFINGPLIPLLTDNRFIANAVAVRVESNAAVRLERNRYDLRGGTVAGAALGTNDSVEALVFDGRLPQGTGDADAYRRLMQVVYDASLEQHPCVIYGLTEQLGEFDVTVLYPIATFSIGAFTPDTRITSYRAFDLNTRDALRASLRLAERPWVDVVNPAVTEKGCDRFVLEKHFAHGPSYTRNDRGQLVFRRATTMARVEIYVPEGYLPVQVNYPAEFDRADGQYVVKIKRPGLLRVELVMERIGAGTADPYGLLEAR